MPDTIFLAAGGTGGHVFPALALAEVLLERGYRVEFLTDKRGEKYLGNTNIMPQIIHSATFAGDWKQKLISGFKIGYGMLQSLEFLREYGPQAVVGFGGYPSFPTMSAAQFLKVPTIIHEQNAIFGRANRQVSQRAAYIATSFEETKNLNLADKSKVVWTGNPLRKNFLGEFPYSAPKKGETIQILIFGGSQGSALFSDIVPKAIELIDPELRRKLIITQQCRKEDMNAVTAIYNKIDISARLEPFFNDMPKLYQKAHLVIGRAGGSVAEITATGRPSILIPLAASLDGDQAQNAQRLVAQKAAWLIEEKDFTPEALAAKLTELINDPELLAQAAIQSASLGKREAADNLADLVVKAMKKD